MGEPWDLEIQGVRLDISKIKDIRTRDREDKPPSGLRNRRGQQCWLPVFTEVRLLPSVGDGAGSSAVMKLLTFMNAFNSLAHQCQITCPALLQTK